MTIHAIIIACADRIAATEEEFDADDVVAALYRDHAREISEHADLLAKNWLRKVVSDVLKRKAGQDPNDPHYEQLKLLGFETPPVNVPFYDGTKVRYIQTLKARRGGEHSRRRVRACDVGRRSADCDRGPIGTASHAGLVLASRRHTARQRAEPGQPPPPFDFLQINQKSRNQKRIKDAFRASDLPHGKSRLARPESSGNQDDPECQTGRAQRMRRIATGARTPAPIVHKVVGDDPP